MRHPFREATEFIDIFTFMKDTRKEGRVLSTIKIGDVYMSRLVIEPGVVTGNLYHKQTNVMMYVESGTIVGIFEHMNTKERKRIQLHPGKHVVHIPRCVAHSTRNIGRTSAVVVLFSNRRLRSGDDHEYVVDSPEQKKPRRRTKVVK